MIKELKSIYEYRVLLQELVLKGIKLKYRRSYLGILWSLLEPILMTIVLTVVFGTLFGNTNPTYPMYILSGRLLFTYFSGTTNTSLRSMKANAAMIRKVYVPKYLYVLSSALSNFIIFLISLIVLVGLCLILHVYPTPYLFLAVIPLALLFLFSLGAGYILATIGVFFRDMEYLWGVLILLIMYCSAIFYYPEKITESSFWWILDFNPVYQIIYMFRQCINGEPFTVYSLVFTLIATLVCLAAGTYIFNKNQDKFVLYV